MKAFKTFILLNLWGFPFLPQIYGVLFKLANYLRQFLLLERILLVVAIKMNLQGLPPLLSTFMKILDYPSQTQNNKQIKHQKTKGNYKKEMYSLCP
jgi:hypothetical protein